MKTISIRLICAFFAAWAAPHSSAHAEPLRAISMHGTPAQSGLEPFSYVDPLAPKGGKLELGLQGTFDSLNPFNLKAGSTAQGLMGNVFQTLMIRSQDEPFTFYGLLAESLETDAARSFVTFHLNPNAHFSDGHPLTTEDVIFSFDLLKTKGRPQQRGAYGQVKRVDVLSPTDIRFDLSGLADREMPLTLALMPILPKHATDVEHFAESSLKIPVGSGPYIIDSIVAGTEVTFKRDPKYWGVDVPNLKGLYNFDTMHVTYMRDPNVVFEAFKAGTLDFITESDATRWLNSYDFPAIQDGRVIKAAQPLGLPKGMDGFAFNTRKPLFSDIRLREAMGLLFDFEWVNAKFYGGLYKRSLSFFDDSVLSSHGRSASEGEMALLKPYPDAVRADILAGTWAPIKSDGSGRDRALPQAAMAILTKAGYQTREGKLYAPNGSAVAFEFMVESREKERLALLYSESLRRVGITTTIRFVDEVQYQRRRQQYDFDMMIGSWAASPSPGNEQRGRWGSAAAKNEGTFNLTGASSIAIDAMIEAVVGATTEVEFHDAVRALDRVLLSGFYIVPLYYKPDQWFAYTSRLEKPAKISMFGITPDPFTTLASWWSKRP